MRARRSSSGTARPRTRRGQSTAVRLCCGAVFERILIAQRGEVAARIARTCKRLGITAIGVRGEHEREGVHLEACDETVVVPVSGRALPPPEAVTAAAKEAGAEAVHPGYALPREHTTLARAVRDAGLAFVGSPEAALVAVQDRSAWRRMGDETGVRLVRGSEEILTDVDRLRSVADEIGYPIAIKPVIAGPVSQLVRVDDDDELDEGYARFLDAARRDGADERALVEHFVDRARHLAVTVVVDAHGEVGFFGERETSLRWGPHRLIEEAPSPALLQVPWGEAIREALGDSAIRLARAVGVVGLATIDFLVDAAGRAWIVGIEVGLPFAHPVTEMVCNVDLVEIELRVAAGEELDEAATLAQPTGHSFEARLVAEDGERELVPCSGVVEDLRFPPGPPGMVRAEPAVLPGEHVDAEADALLAKIVTFAPIRHQALLVLDRVLAETHVAPLATNIKVLRRVLGHESFRAGHYDEAFVGRILS